MHTEDRHTYSDTHTLLTLTCLKSSSSKFFSVQAMPITNGKLELCFFCIPQLFLECYELLQDSATKVHKPKTLIFNTLNAGGHFSGSKVDTHFLSFTHVYLPLPPSICLPRLSECLSRIFSWLKARTGV